MHTPEQVRHYERQLQRELARLPADQRATQHYNITTFIHIIMNTAGQGET